MAALLSLQPGHDQPLRVYFLQKASMQSSSFNSLDLNVFEGGGEYL